MTPHRRTAPLVATALLALLTACGTSEPTVTPPPAGDGAPAPATQEQAPAVDDTTKPYGSTATWPDGVAVTISKPAPFKPSDTAAGTEGAKRFRVVEVTLKNGTTEPVEAYTLNLRATSGEDSVDPVADIEQDVTGATSARVMPGKTTRWREAWPMPGDDLLITAEWGFEGQPVTFK